MREIRLFGSEGGVALTLPSLPLSSELALRALGARDSSRRTVTAGLTLETPQRPTCNPRPGGLKSALVRL